MPTHTEAADRPVTERERDAMHAYVVGGGIGGLAAAVYLVRDGGLPGAQVHVLEQGEPGGSLDAGGSAAGGYLMRGSRMFGAAYVLSYELLDGIASLEDPAKSVAQDLFEFWQEAPWHDRARLIDAGRVLDPTDWGLDVHDQAALIRLMLQDEACVEGLRIDECAAPSLFGTHFWFMWSSMFGFETWHSAAELRRYLLRFLLLFPHLETMQLIQCTRYNGRDSIVRPIVRWLQQRGVDIQTGVQVRELQLDEREGQLAVRAIETVRDGRPATIELGAGDIVIATLGSMSADSSCGSMDAPPVLRTDPDAGAWGLWRRLAARSSRFGRPWTFCGHLPQTQWITFTVTERDERFFEHVEALSHSSAGQGGLVTLPHSSWMLTFHLYHRPAYAPPAEDRPVWWGYGLLPDRPGDHVGKPMSACSGRELLTELYAHLGLQEHTAALLEGATCIPCWLPYTTSQFMPRRAGDRPEVLPEGTRNLALIGQYVEIPDDVVYTVEYSVHGARLAVDGLLGLETPRPPTYQGLRHASALVGALQRLLTPALPRAAG